MDHLRTMAAEENTLERTSPGDVPPLAASAANRWEGKNSPLDFFTRPSHPHPGFAPSPSQTALGKARLRYDETRWLPQFPQSWNRYAYVGNTPLVATDPWGLHAACPDTGACNWDDWGCTLDGMAEDCAGLQHWAGMDPEGGGFYACPDNQCPSGRVVNGPAGQPEIWMPTTAVSSVVIGATGNYGGPTISPGYWEVVGSAESCAWGGGCSESSVQNGDDLVLPSGSGGTSLLQSIRHWIAAYGPTITRVICGQSPSAVIYKSTRNGAALGAAFGVWAGGFTGEVFGGEVTLGLSGVPGALVGGLLGGGIGAMRGSLTGLARAAGCDALGLYN